MTDQRAAGEHPTLVRRNAPDSLSLYRLLPTSRENELRCQYKGLYASPSSVPLGRVSVMAIWRMSLATVFLLALALLYVIDGAHGHHKSGGSSCTISPLGVGQDDTQNVCLVGQQCCFIRTNQMRFADLRHNLTLRSRWAYCF